jgi:hypothetical protein
VADSDFGMRQRSRLLSEISRRRLLRASAGAGLALSLGRAGSRAAQEITYSRDFEGTTLNLLMEDLLETTIIEELLPEFTELTGISVNFEKVAYPVMREKLVPQLAAGPGSGSYDVLEVDFYWVFEFARSGWVEDLGPRIEASGGQVDLARFIPALLEIGSTVDGKTRLSRPPMRSRPAKRSPCPTASRGTWRWPRPFPRSVRTSMARRCRRSRSTRS